MHGDIGGPVGLRHQDSQALTLPAAGGNCTLQPRDARDFLDGVPNPRATATRSIRCGVPQSRSNRAGGLALRLRQEAEDTSAIVVYDDYVQVDVSASGVHQHSDVVKEGEVTHQGGYATPASGCGHTQGAREKPVDAVDAPVGQYPEPGPGP